MKLRIKIVFLLMLLIVLFSYQFIFYQMTVLTQTACNDLGWGIGFVDWKLDRYCGTVIPDGDDYIFPFEEALGGKG